MQCGPHWGGCSGSEGDGCFIDSIWSSAYVDGLVCRTGYLSGSRFGADTHPCKMAFSVRCMDFLLIRQMNGYMLCDHVTAASVRCDWLDGCSGARNNRCHPYHIWSSSTVSGSLYNTPLVQGVFSAGYNNASETFSVRCFFGFDR